MSVREIIQELQRQGHKVSFFVRKDGGVRITKIDETRFTGSQGNIVARTMIGTSLSERRSRQLESIRTPKGKFGHKTTTKLSPEMTKALRKAQRLFRKYDVKGGKPTTRNLRYIIKEKGETEAFRRLNQSIRYAKGLAYEENVDWLIKKLEEIQGKLDRPSNSLKKAIEKLRERKSDIREVQLQQIYALGTTSDLGIDVYTGILPPDFLGDMILEIIG